MPLAQPDRQAGDQTTATQRGDDGVQAGTRCSTSSIAIVPWPAMVRGSSKGGTNTAPVRSASALAAAPATS